MANTYYATIYARFYNPAVRDTWLKEHGVNQSIPNGGPVTSYSQEYEGLYRDQSDELIGGLKDLLKDYLSHDDSAYCNLGVDDRLVSRIQSLIYKIERKNNG